MPGDVRERGILAEFHPWYPSVGLGELLSESFSESPGMVLPRCVGNGPERESGRSLVQPDSCLKSSPNSGMSVLS
jgi:hypothetical protein